MTKDELEAYVGRAWDQVAASKVDWWMTLVPAEKLRVADELRKQVLAQTKDWPSKKDRDEDLRSHKKVARLLAQASRARSAAR